jgi:hypothetical protein
MKWPGTRTRPSLQRTSEWEVNLSQDNRLTISKYAVLTPHYDWICKPPGAVCVVSAIRYLLTGIKAF